MFGWFKKKPEEPKEAEIDPYDNLDLMGYTAYDEHLGLTVSVLMVCGCGNPTIRLVEGSDLFYCLHCDRGCDRDKPCEDCQAHYQFDAERTKAEWTYFTDEQDEDEEDR